MDQDREFKACHRFARISPRKARYVMDLVRGLPVERALNDLRFSLKRATPMISKVIRSALANATQEAGLETANLYIAQAMVDVGPRIKRFKPRAMGRAYPRLRRTCHLSVVLREKAPQEEKGRPAGAAASQGGAPAGEAKGRGGRRKQEASPGTGGRARSKKGHTGALKEKAEKAAGRSPGRRDAGEKGTP
jgi:large subunit ribosomal protein L22